MGSIATGIEPTLREIGMDGGGYGAWWWDEDDMELELHSRGPAATTRSVSIDTFVHVSTSTRSARHTVAFIG